MHSYTLVLLIAVVAITWACKAPQNPTKDWWQTAQFYQIYPRSFMDSNNDGVGDLNGITSKLEYLKEIGVTATWLSPIFTSPMADFGYDIANFTNIHAEFGTLDDFDRMIKRANELGIKIILDFVPNHSSDEHEWFIKSEKREKGYEDLYIWDDGKPNAADPTQRDPPSNWLSHFRGSAWKWSDKRKQFYYHAFHEKQPDLNYRNPKVVQLMKDVLTFWLDRGVAGFRCDTVPDLFERAPENGVYLDEPVNPNQPDTDNYDYLQHPYVVEQPETIDMTYQWRQVLIDHQRQHAGDTRVLMIETYSPPSYSLQFYGNKTTDGAQIPFNFNLITKFSADKGASELLEAINAWMKVIPAGKTPNWVIGNHDQKRASTRYGETRTDFMNMLVMLMPGISVTYQGEELGALDGVLSWEETVDPAACNSNPEIYEEFSRDPCRTPFQWDTSKNAGFSNADKTWLPVASSYKEYNVDVESKATGKSHLKIYKELVNFRSSKLIRFGSHHYSQSNDIFVLKRWLTTGEVLVLVANLGKQERQNFDLSAHDTSLPSSLDIVLTDVNSNKNIGSKLNTQSVSLKPNEAVVASGSLTTTKSYRK